MAKRFTASRIAGITAWSAAAVAWGTAAVAFVTPQVSSSNPAEVMNATAPLAPARDSALIPEFTLPTMPETGLVVIRYTPVDRPEPEVIIERGEVATTSPQARAPWVQSSGS